MIAAFDMGIKNFAFAVKDKGDFVLLKNTSLDDSIMTKSDLNKYKKKELLEMAQETFNICELQNLKKEGLVDLILKGKNKKVKKDLGTSMFQIMDTYKNTWENCDVFLIERQLPINLQALKLSHYLEAYLKIYYPDKKILNYNSTTKTKKLGATNLKAKRDRKEWAIQYTTFVLKDDNLRYFKALKKQDDIADVVCMIESYTVKQ